MGLVRGWRGPLLWIGGVGACAAVVGCVAAGAPPAVAGPVAEAAARLELPLDAVQRGHDLFVVKCVRCHSAPAPGAYSEEEWGRILPRMARRAKLDGAAESDVRAYVLAARGVRPDGAR
jgi:hypothetical protein